MSAPINRAEFRRLSRLVAQREKALAGAQERLNAARRECEARATDWNNAKAALRQIVEASAGVRIWP